MSIKSSIKNDVGIVKLSGKLMGPPETDLLSDEITYLLSEGLRKIIIDMKSARWINSVGIGVMMKCYTSVKNKQGEMVLAALSDKVHSIFVITQLVRIFNIYYSTKEAIKGMHPEAIEV